MAGNFTATSSERRDGLPAGMAWALQVARTVLPNQAAIAFEPWCITTANFSIAVEDRHFVGRVAVSDAAQ